MIAVRVARLLLIALLATFAAGCGGEKQAASGAAEIAPATAPAFVSIDSNVDSDQWQEVEALLRKFPDGEQLIRTARSSFEEDSELDWERDVEPALGDELAFVWLDFEGGGQNVVGLTQPKDEDKFRQAVEKANESDGSGEDVLIGEVGGWLVLSDAQAKIDRFREEAEGEDLSADETFKDALAELPEESLVTAFARGENLVSAFRRALGGITGGAVPQLQAGQQPEFIAAALAAQTEGMRLVTASRAAAEAASQVEPYKSKLLADVPGDAVAFLTFHGGSAFERQLRQLPGEGLREFERMFGLEIDAITALFENEVALYVRAGTPIPEITLLLEAPDEQAALRTVDDLVEKMALFNAGRPCGEPEEQAGVTVQCVEFGDFKIRYAAFDDKVVVTTGAQSIEEIRSGGPRLADDESFKEAREAAGLPDENGGFLWFDLEDGLPLVFGLADFADEQVPPEVRRNLEPLRSLVAWAEEEGRMSKAQLFLAID
jgi:hypothetical protein